MKTRLVLLLSLLCLLAVCSYSLKKEPLFLQPKSWPKPVYSPDKKNFSQASIDLGRILFYDPILSKDSTISCSSCHLSYTSFTHVDHALSHGIQDRIGNRNSPVLINLAWSPSFMWDGAVSHLEVQSLAPIANPLEMDEKIEHVVEKLKRKNLYKKLFFKAFGDTNITGQRTTLALAHFMTSLVSANAKYDRVMRGEESFSEQEQKGLLIFRKHCEACHKEPLFSSYSFANNGLPEDSLLKDKGRAGISQKPSDHGLFKIPTLRNIEVSFPYMHDGRFRKLSQVLAHYSTGIQPNENLSPLLKNGINLSANEKVELTAFLLCLTDKEFLLNKKHAYPSDLLSKLLN